MSKTLKEKFRDLIKELKNENFTDVQAADGTTYRIEGSGPAAQGNKITCIGADGTETPAPDGPVTLSDGTSVVVKNGVIDSITPASSDATAAPATDTKPTPNTPPADTATPAMAATPADSAAPLTVDNNAPQDAQTSTSSTDPKVIEALQMIMDRLDALESKSSETTMAVEHMSSQSGLKLPQEMKSDFFSGLKNTQKVLASNPNRVRAQENFSQKVKPATEEFKKMEDMINNIVPNKEDNNEVPKERTSTIKFNFSSF